MQDSDYTEHTNANSVYRSLDTQINIDKSIFIIRKENEFILYMPPPAQKGMS